MKYVEIFHRLSISNFVYNPDMLFHKCCCEVKGAADCALILVHLFLMNILDVCLQDIFGSTGPPTLGANNFLAVGGLAYVLGKMIIQLLLVNEILVQTVGTLVYLLNMFQHVFLQK